MDYNTVDTKLSLTSSSLPMLADASGSRTLWPRLNIEDITGVIDG